MARVTRANSQVSTMVVAPVAEKPGSMAIPSRTHSAQRSAVQAVLALTHASKSVAVPHHPRPNKLSNARWEVARATPIAMEDLVTATTAQCLGEVQTILFNAAALVVVRVGATVSQGAARRHQPHHPQRTK